MFSPTKEAVVRVADDEERNEKADGVQRELCKVGKRRPKTWRLVATYRESVAAEDIMIRRIEAHNQQRD